MKWAEVSFTATSGKVGGQRRGRQSFERPPGQEFAASAKVCSASWPLRGSIIEAFVAAPTALVIRVNSAQYWQRESEFCSRATFVFGGRCGRAVFLRLGKKDVATVNIGAKMHI